jgi:hypothetical protein
MLYIISIVLAFLWGLGLLTSNTLGGFLHILVIFAVGLPLIQLLRKRSQRIAQLDHESRIHLGRRGTV